MSPKEREEESEQKLPAAPPTSAEKAGQQAGAAKPGLEYVFKIAPADPKRNSIDFEDVADK